MDVNRVGLFPMVIQIDNGSLSNGHAKRHYEARTQTIQPITFGVSFNLNDIIQIEIELERDELDRHSRIFKLNDTPNVIGCIVCVLASECRFA